MTHRLSIVWALAALCVVAGARVPAQQSTSISTTGLVERFTRVGFPELSDRDLTVRVNTEAHYDSPWNIGFVGVAIRKRTHLEGSQVDDPVLTASFDINVIEGFVDGARFSGPHVHSSELKRVAQEAAAKPEDSRDAELEAILVRMHAAFPPSRREAFERDLHLERFVPITGPLRLLDAQFLWRQGDDIMEPHWAVRAAVDGQAGRQSCVSASFEPLDGRLTLFHYAGDLLYNSPRCVQ